MAETEALGGAKQENKRTPRDKAMRHAEKTNAKDKNEVGYKIAFSQLYVRHFFFFFFSSFKLRRQLTVVLRTE